MPAMFPVCTDVPARPAAKTAKITEHVDLAIFSFGLRNHSDPLLFAADVERAVFGNATSAGDLFRDRIAEVILHIAQHDDCAVHCELPRRFGTNTRSPAGDDCYFVEKPLSWLHVCSPFWLSLTVCYRVFGI
jgi:hypothetical protein